MAPKLVDYLLYEPEDSGILWIKFNRPERMNALVGTAATVLDTRKTTPGLRILEKIERVDYDVFRRRPVLRALDWPLLLARAV